MPGGRLPRCRAVAACSLLPLPVCLFHGRALLRLLPSNLVSPIQQTSTEVFFRKAKFWDGQDGKDAPPAFHVDGVQYLHVKVRVASPLAVLQCCSGIPSRSRVCCSAEAGSGCASVGGAQCL